MTDPFVAQLAELSKAHVPRAKWVFVPGHGVGRTMGESIALAGTHWLNLRFVTPLDIALRMGAPFLVQRGIDPSEEGLGPALIMRLLLTLRAEATEAPQAGPVREQPHFVLAQEPLSRVSAPREAGRPRSRPPAAGASDTSGYFRHLADQPTMAEALYATVRELRMAGVKAKDLEAEAFESKAKHAELKALLVAYERFLKDNNRGDMADVYEEAMQHPTGARFSRRIAGPTCPAPSGLRWSVGSSTPCPASGSCRERCRCRHCRNGIRRL